MADGKELKPKSFRIDDETAEKFKEISNTIGGNQQETLAKLIEAFEFQSGKAVLTNKKADIEQFEKYVNILTRMFMGSLEDNQNITETVRADFEAMLKSKDATIQDLQEKLAAAKQLKEDSALKAKAQADENARLGEVVDGLNRKLTDMQSMLSDKESLNKALTASCNDLQIKADGLKKAAEQAGALREELDALAREKSDLERQLQQEQAKHEIEMEKAVLQAEKALQEQIQMLKAEKQAEVDRYQQKYFELLEQMKSQTAADAL